MTETIKAALPSSRSMVQTAGKTKKELKNVFSPEESAFFKLSKEEQQAKVKEAIEKRGADPSAESISDELDRINLKKSQVDEAIRKMERNYNDNYFLISTLEDLVAHNQKNSYGKYFTSLRSEGSLTPQNLFNMFSGIDEFNKITPMQVSLLSPYMRFSLLKYGKGGAVAETEIPFQGGYLDTDSSMLDPFSRGQVAKGNIGIKQFQWNFRGKDPAYQGTLDASLTIFCDSLALLDKEPYRTLIARTQTGIEIKAVVGWSASTGARELLGDNLFNAVRQARATLVMTMNQFEFNFDQDGSFELVIDYTGRVDSFGKKFDLLEPSSVLGDTDLAAATDSLNTMKDLSVKAGPVREGGPTATATLDELLAAKGVSDLETLRMVDEEAAFLIENQIANEVFVDATAGFTEEELLNAGRLRDEIKKGVEEGDVVKPLENYLVNEVETRTGKRRQENMSKIQRMLNNFSTDDKRISILKVDKAAYDNYKESIAARSDAIQTNKRIKEGNAKLASVEAEVNDAQRPNNPNAVEAAKIKESQEELNKQTGSGQDKAAKGPKQKPKDLVVEPDITANPTGVSISAGEILSEINYDSQDAANSHYISFFYLGDLIEVIHKIAEETGRSRQMPYMILGSFSFKNHFKNTSQMIEMADIPITVGRFNAWFHRNYIAKKVTSIRLSNFMRNILRDLVRPVFTGEAFYNSPASGNPGVASMVEGEMSAAKFSTKILGRQNLTSLTSGQSGLFHYPGDAPPKPYVLISSNLNKPISSGGNRTEDRKKGIMHYYMGQDAGLVHNVNFQMEPISGLRESAIVSANQNSLIDVARQPYRVGMQTLGNTIFTVGSKFYLLPTLPGKSAAVTAGRLGLGGYYIVNAISNTISPGRFDTTVQAIQESMAFYNKKGALSNEKSDSGTNSLSKEKVK